MATTILFLVFALLLVLGIPVAFALIAASLATVLYLGLPAIVVVQQTAAGISGTSLIAKGDVKRVKRYLLPGRA